MLNFFNSSLLCFNFQYFLHIIYFSLQWLQWLNWKIWINFIFIKSLLPSTFQIFNSVCICVLNVWARSKSLYHGTSSSLPIETMSGAFCVGIWERKLRKFWPTKIKANSHRDLVYQSILIIGWSAITIATHEFHIIRSHQHGWMA